MTNTTTISISTINGPVTINAELFQNYVNEAFEYLDEIEELKGKLKEQKDLLKEVVETVAETTKLDKKVVAKYFTARHEESTKATKELGELFSALDEATVGE